ncbi:MAG: hypothetical protein HQK51_06070 [Oligoflexia bacterium]|nr:hypothetical protein [Oligoflexia bacterium]
MFIFDHRNISFYKQLQQTLKLGATTAYLIAIADVARNASEPIAGVKQYFNFPENAYFSCENL